ncbi:hypothetical protein [Chengkuizengella axinellae]|uniref:Uncharacterized protein n=1 Tax=Chengkuizengella axinellae TaxID=3064388 RepID=A0ABT9J0F7_9BACL|nr:hypothetical protein [Chengkuizengella sp. 2205SS18-9]MDP5275104.1 hypothetical protein [Chengkuizengella sp. 2205SS18-9]
MIGKIELEFTTQDHDFIKFEYCGRIPRTFKTTIKGHRDSDCVIKDKYIITKNYENGEKTKVEFSIKQESRFIEAFLSLVNKELIDKHGNSEETKEDIEKREHEFISILEHNIKNIEDIAKEDKAIPQYRYKHGINDRYSVGEIMEIREVLKSGSNGDIQFLLKGFTEDRNEFQFKTFPYKYFIKYDHHKNKLEMNYFMFKSNEKKERFDFDPQIFKADRYVNINKENLKDLFHLNLQEYDVIKQKLTEIYL